MVLTLAKHYFLMGIIVLTSGLFSVLLPEEPFQEFTVDFVSPYGQTPPVMAMVRCRWIQVPCRPGSPLASPGTGFAPLPCTTGVIHNFFNLCSSPSLECFGFPFFFFCHCWEVLLLPWGAASYLFLASLP